MVKHICNNCGESKKIDAVIWGIELCKECADKYKAEYSAIVAVYQAKLEGLKNKYDNNSTE